MVGILSLMPTLIGNSMAEILTQLPVAPPVHNALLDHAGVLGDLLSLIETLEKSTGANDLAAVKTILNRFPEIDVGYANSCLTKALTWANHLAQESA
jgi:c-di-GMP-related signal transduction protein